MPAWLGGALAVLAVAAAAHAATGPLFRSNAIPRFLALGALAGLGLGYGLGAVYGLGIRFWSGLLVYALGCELYLFVFTLSLYSVSANLLVRLRHGALDQERINALYDSSRMVELRIDRLLEKNLLYRDGDRLRLTEAGARLAATFARVATFFGIVP